MTYEEVLEKLRGLMKAASREAIDWDTVDDTAAIETLGFDSLTLLVLIYDIQQAFDLEFDAEELIDVRTVGELGAFLQERLA